MYSNRFITSYVSFILFAVLTSLLFTGCATTNSRVKTKYEPFNNAVAAKYNINQYMYVKESYRDFRKGEEVKVKGVRDYKAYAYQGYIPLYKLSKNKPIEKTVKNQKFKLKVTAPKYSRIRILNIKPKYHDNILLAKGNYHIEVSKSGYQTFKKWITVNKDLDYHVEDLKQIEKIQIFKVEDGKYECPDKSENIILTFKTSNSITSWDMANKSTPTLMLSDNLKKRGKGTIVLNVIKSSSAYTLNMKVINNKTKKEGNKNIGTFVKDKDGYIFDSQGKKSKCKKI